MANVTSLLRFSFGFSFVRAWTEMKLWCIKGMLKLVSSEKKKKFEGVEHIRCTIIIFLFKW